MLWLIEYSPLRLCHIVDNSFSSLVTLHSAVTNRLMLRHHDYAFYVPQLHLDVLKFLCAVRTAQHSTAQHSTAQHSTAQHSTAQHSTAQHSTALVNVTSASKFWALLHATNLMHFMRRKSCTICKRSVKGLLSCISFVIILLFT